MATLKTGDIELYYECHGSGPPLMLIAGIASDSQSWMPVVPELARHFTLVLPDNRGAGRTGPDTAPLTIPAIARDCAALMTHLGHERMHVLGHSMGGAIAQTLVLEHPERVDHLVLAATGAKLSMRNRILFNDLSALRQGGVDPLLWYKILFQWLFRPAFFADERAVNGAAEQALAYAYAQSGDNFARQLAAAQKVDHREQLGQIAAPTLVMAAEDDLLFSPAAVRALSQAIAGARFALVKNAAHSLHWDNPHGFCAVVREFLLPERDESPESSSSDAKTSH